MFNFFKKIKNQKGQFKKPYYSITSKHSGRIIDVAQNGQNQGTTILWNEQGENQQFTLKQKGNYYYLKCKRGNKYLTVEGPHDGSRIFVAPKSKAEEQRFHIDERKPGVKQYVIYTYCGKVLDCEGQGKNKGTRIVQWDYNGGDNQIWTFNDHIEITSSSSDQN